MYPINLSKLRDAVFGLAVGDALGVPYEFKRRGTFEACGMEEYGTHNVPKGTFSDDTSLVLATCDSLKSADGKLNVPDMRARFLSWAEEGTYTVDGVFDIGYTTRMALVNKKGMDEYRDNGNGSLMRIIPMAFVRDVSDDQIREASAITHAHDISKTACVIYVHIARHLLQGLPVKGAIGQVDCQNEFYRIPGVWNLREYDICSNGYVVNTLEAALWCLSTTENYRDCVLKAVNLGDDTDTVAAVAGGLAGIVYGKKNIPNEWLGALRGKDLIEACL